MMGEGRGVTFTTMNGRVKILRMLALALSTDKNLHKTDNGLFCTLCIFPPVHQNDCLQSLCPLFLYCLLCNWFLWINTGVELQLKITRLHWANVLGCNKRVWANCRSRLSSFSLILFHFSWWIGTLNKGFRSFLDKRYRASPRHSPEKNLIFFS